MKSAKRRGRYITARLPDQAAYDAGGNVVFRMTSIRFRALGKVHGFAHAQPARVPGGVYVFFPRDEMPHAGVKAAAPAHAKGRRHARV